MEWVAANDRPSWQAGVTVRAAVLLFLAVLGGCGGGGGGGSPAVFVDGDESTVSFETSGSIVADGVSTATLRVVVRDGGGTPLVGIPVAVSVTVLSSGATVTPSSGTTDTEGVFEAELTSTVAGTLSIRVTAGDSEVPLSGEPDIEFVAGPPSAAESSVVMTPAVVPSDGTTASTITVTITDAQGNPIEGESVDLSANGAGHTITPTSGTTNSQGMVTAGITSTSAETKTVSATVDPAGSAVVLNQQPSVQFLGPPQVDGLARYSDTNSNGAVDAGDRLHVPFDRAIALTAAVVGDLDAPVTGDTFGTGATVAAGDVDEELVITLGTNPSLKARQDFEVGQTTTNSASGVDVNAGAAAGAIAGTQFSLDAAPSTPIDITPTFVKSAQTLGSGIVTDVALADLNGDGALDAILVLTGANQTYLNNGSGTFTLDQSFGSSASTSLATGDIDRDGDVDVVVGNSGSANRVWLNDGFGVLTDSGQTLGSALTQKIVLADVDRDGELDLFAGNQSADDVLYLNTSGVFAPDQNLSSDSTGDAALFDADNDGDLDLLAGSMSGSMSRIWINDGLGTLSETGATLDDDLVASICAGDVDRDGDVDLALLGLETRLYLGNGLGGFTLSSFDGDISSAADFADFDQDSDPDWITASTLGVIPWVNDGAANFVESGSPDSGSLPTSLALGDVDGDGDVDALVGNLTKVEIWLGSLAGAWGSATFVDDGQDLDSVAFDGPLAIGDVDGDQDLDVFVPDATASTLLLNSGDGTLTDSGDSFGHFDFPVFGDIDGDGDLDLLDSFGGGQVFTNDGSGTFTDTLQTPFSGVALKTGDFDRDGDLDVATAGTNVKLYQNNGTGTFSDSGQTILPGIDADDLEAADVDSDGDLDLLVPDQVAGSRVVLNNGSGTLTDSGQLLATTAPLGLVVLDADGDGDPDMAFASGSGNANTVFLNNGSGTFSDSGQSLGTSTSLDLDAVDIDGDGDLDLIEARTNTGEAYVYLNDGSGTFGATAATLGTGERLRTGDLDQDGDVDLVIVVDGVLEVFKNQ